MVISTDHLYIPSWVMVVVVHPWDNARLQPKWNLLGRGHVDDIYERHIQRKLAPFLRRASKAGALIAYNMDSPEFRVHPAIEELRDFVIYLDDGWENYIYRQGITSLLLCGYARDICVESFYKKWKNAFNIEVMEEYCLSAEV